jgi:CheY-like chemotaxis protein
MNVDAKSKILIVDDDPDFVEVTRAVLRSEGYQVASAADGDEALKKISSETPDLVLLDVMMDWPLEGVRVSREMMERRELRDIPIIMITSIRNSEYRAVFPQNEYLHIDSWIDKPCSPSKLLSEIESALARRQKSKSVA